MIGEEFHGFRAGRGTTSGVLDLLEQMQTGVEEGGIATMLGCDISSAFDVLPREKLLRQMKEMAIGEKSLEMMRDYFSERTQQVEIGIARGQKRPTLRGVLQGSALSPVLFLIFFLRGGVANRKCQTCQEDLLKKVNQRRNCCHRCGNNTVYADDLNVVGRIMSFNRRFIEKNISNQGNRILSTLRKTGLSLNKKKSQFMCIMNSQRRKASALTDEERMERMKKLSIQVGNSTVKNESVKTL